MREKEEQDNIIDNTTVDKILEEAINGGYFTKREKSYYKFNNIGKLFEKNVSLLEQYKVLEEKEKGKYYPNDLAYKLKNANGVQNHLKNKKKRSEKAEKKENYDYLFSKYRYWTYWVVFSIGLYGGIDSFYDSFIKSNANIKDVKELEVYKEELKEVRTLIYNQTKKVDSLHAPKIRHDSLE
jgi:hypothetical protein